MGTGDAPSGTARTLGVAAATGDTGSQRLGPERLGPERLGLQRLGLNFVLVATMVLGPFPLMAPAVVAADLIDALGTTTGAFGVALTMNTVAAALFAPVSGRLTDSIGPKLSTVLTIATSGAGLVVMSAAPNIWVLTIAAAFAGLGQGWCNPATNKLIAERVPHGQRGTITGLKQSGVMLGSFLAGATLPALAVWFGWRVGVGIYGVVSLACAAGIGLWMRPDSPAASRPAAACQAQQEPRPPAAAAPRRIRRTPAARAPIARAPIARAPMAQAGRAERRYIVAIAWYSLLMGAVVGGVGRFQPLFAEQSLGWSNFWAGLSSALVGITAVGARIWWARLTEARVQPASALAVQAGLTVAAMALLLGATGLHAGLLWAASLLAGFTLASWNAVAMLAIISGVPVTQAGRASGIVMAGFMSGLSIGGLATGYVAQWFGGFEGAWAGFAVCAAGATAIASAMRRRRPLR